MKTLEKLGFIENNKFNNDEWIYTFKNRVSSVKEIVIIFDKSEHSYVIFEKRYTDKDNYKNGNIRPYEFSSIIDGFTFDELCTAINLEYNWLKFRKSA